MDIIAALVASSLSVIWLILKAKETVAIIVTTHFQVQSVAK